LSIQTRENLSAQFAKRTLKKKKILKGIKWFTAKKGNINATSAVKVLNKNRTYCIIN
jgi:hypothetical protein